MLRVFFLVGFIEGRSIRSMTKNFQKMKKIEEKLKQLLSEIYPLQELTFFPIFLWKIRTLPDLSEIGALTEYMWET